MGKIRTFLAVDISSPVRACAAKWIERCRQRSQDYRWVEPENLHLTLNFLGDVLERDISEVCQAAERALHQVRSFEISFVGLGGFPRTDRPRVVWMGIGAGHQELCGVQKRLSDAFLEIGFPTDRQRYTPHLTLGRVRREGRCSDGLVELLSGKAQTAPMTCLVSEVVVYSSFLEKAGPTYTAMSRIRLNERLPTR